MKHRARGNGKSMSSPGSLIRLKKRILDEQEGSTSQWIYCEKKYTASCDAALRA